MTPTRVPTASDYYRRGAKGEGSKKELEDKSKGAGEGHGQFAGHGASLRFAGVWQKTQLLTVRGNPISRRSIDVRADPLLYCG